MSEHDADAVRSDAEIVEAIRNTVETLNDLQGVAADQGIEFDIECLEYGAIGPRKQVHYRLTIVKPLWRDGDDY